MSAQKVVLNLHATASDLIVPVVISLWVGPLSGFFLEGLLPSRPSRLLN